MKKSEEKVLEQIITNCKALSETNKSYVMGLTEGMALVGGLKNGEKARR